MFEHSSGWSQTNATIPSKKYTAVDVLSNFALDMTFLTQHMTVLSYDSVIILHNI